MPKIHVMPIGDVNPKVVEEITEIIEEIVEEPRWCKFTFIDDADDFRSDEVVSGWQNGVEVDFAPLDVLPMWSADDDLPDEGGTGDDEDEHRWTVMSLNFGRITFHSLDIDVDPRWDADFVNGLNEVVRKRFEREVD